MAINMIKSVYRKYPYISNSFTYGCMCVGAEFSQQFMTKRFLHPQTPPEPIDIDVLKRYSVIGFGVNPTLLYFWYKWLDKTFVGTARSVIVKKVMLDQLLFTPPLYAVFYISMSLMEKKPDVFEELKTKFSKTFQTSCMFWLPAQTVNFLLIPNSYRVSYVGVCSFIWLNILLWLKRTNVE